MSSYELTFLIQDEGETKTVKEIIESYSGKVTSEEKWGKKTFAYPINKLTEAYYFLWGVEIDSKNILELKKKLNFNDKLLRYLLLKIEIKPSKVKKS